MSGRYAYLGPAGTFTEAALRTLPGIADAALDPRPSVAAAFEAVRRGEAEAALVPLENSVEGSVAATLDELARRAPLQIVREVLLPVRLALLARTGTALHAIRCLLSHPHAAAQCRGYLSRHLPEVDVLPALSTAAAAAAVAEGRAPYDAAIAAPLAAERYGLVVLADDIGDRADAVTRFILVRRPGPPPRPTGADRTTLVFVSDDRPGALVSILAEFARRGVNLTRLESRPTGERLGAYSFSMDCDGHVEEPSLQAAIVELQGQGTEIRVLGSYPRAA